MTPIWPGQPYGSDTGGDTQMQTHHQSEYVHSVACDAESKIPRQHTCQLHKWLLAAHRTKHCLLRVKASQHTGGELRPSQRTYLVVRWIGGVYDQLVARRVVGVTSIVVDCNGLAIACRASLHLLMDYVGHKPSYFLVRYGNCRCLFCRNSLKPVEQKHLLRSLL